MRTTILAIALAMLVLAAAACQHDSAVFPDARELAAVTEPKPRPPVDILTDPEASDRYSSALEAWGDRLHSAGGRLCRFFREQGMEVECPVAD